MLVKLRSFLVDLWRLARPYWSSDERWAARGLLAMVIALSLGGVFISVEINKWQNEFYNSLQEKNQAEFMRLLGRFSWLAGIAIVMGVYQLYLTQMLQIRWRRWLTARYVDEWLAGRTYYRMQLMDRATDNPDQRIADDLNQFVSITLSLTLGLLNAVVTLVSFLAILWGLSGALNFAIGSTEFTIPGYLVWVALAYALAGTWCAHRIGQPLVGLNFNRQRVEADFRFSLVRFRENTEGVALYGGEDGEKRNFHTRFTSVMANWYEIMIRQKKLTWFQSFYGQVAIIFPYIVVAPRYFSGAIPIGGLMQTASAFGQVQGSLSWFIDAYTRLADWKATVDRLIGFRNAIERSQQDATSAHGIERGESAGAVVEAHDLQLELPTGRELIRDASIKVTQGDAVLVTGGSGSGKSTLFRALCGIWPFGRGRVLFPAKARVLFLPQKPYLPVASLREAVSYPSAPEAFPDAEIRAALQDCELGHLGASLDEQQNWGLLLSGGELQRIAFARVLLNRPDWLFLDEATSAMDEPMEQRMYRLVRERLPGVGIVSIGHRAGLVALHNRTYAVERDSTTGGRLVPHPAPA
jgi:putative ATP-binding cassette transporter